MNEKDMKPYYDLIVEVWKTMKTDLQLVSDDPTLWDQLLDKYGKLSDRYQETPAAHFAVLLCSDCLRELEHVRRKEDVSA